MPDWIRFRRCGCVRRRRCRCDRACNVCVFMHEYTRVHNMCMRGWYNLLFSKALTDLWLVGHILFELIVGYLSAVMQPVQQPHAEPNNHNHPPTHTLNAHKPPTYCKYIWHNVCTIIWCITYIWCSTTRRVFTGNPECTIIHHLFKPVLGICDFVSNSIPPVWCMHLSAVPLLFLTTQPFCHWRVYTVTIYYVCWRFCGPRLAGSLARTNAQKHTSCVLTHTHDTYALTSPHIHIHSNIAYLGEGCVRIPRIICIGGVHAPMPIVWSNNGESARVRCWVGALIVQACGVPACPRTRACPRVPAFVAMI